MTATQQNASSNGSANAADVDVVVVGAGFSGLYLIHRLRQLGLSMRVLESADDVGGTWYWNRYPGARCDIPTTDYTYSFDPELEHAWTWSEKYATQPEILRYAQFITERYDLRRDITFDTKVVSADWDDATSKWHVHTSGGETITAAFYIMATGCLSVPKEPDVPGAKRFTGPTYVTGRWPHEGVDFTGKRVAVIGTGSSGIQSIPLIAAQAAQLTVFQRTPNFSVPAHNGPVRPERRAPLEADRAGYREAAKWSVGGIPSEVNEITALSVPPEVRRERFEKAWAAGELFEILGVFADQGVNPEANDIISEMIREKIREIVKDPATAELLCPKDHYFGTKRPCLDTNYYATYNLPHVRLVDLRSTPITSITEHGIDLPGESLEFDAIVYATGFDAMTGAIVNVDIAGRNGVTLKEKWQHGPTTYLGLMTTGFPNFFSITGPGSPSVLSNMMVSIEQHVDWVTDTLAHLRDKGFTTIEPTQTAEDGWVLHVNDCADLTLHPRANSWYIGANVPGKPRVFMPYMGGVDGYRRVCDEVAGNEYVGFRLNGPGGEHCVDGVVRRVQPDVAMVLEMMAMMELPTMESMSPTDARMFSEAGAAVRPPGPEVGEMVDGTLPGADGTPLEYRLYRPATPGPHPVVVYFHGGGWVIGSHVSDEPMCRDLCVKSDTVIVSVNYRHAPEARFPTAALDGLAATRWVAEHVDELGGIPGKLVVAGWSAGANVAAVVAQLARDEGGPALSGQLLLTPVTDGSRRSDSYHENGEGYLLTAALMNWFWNHYADEAERADPKASPLLHPNLAGLPPALVVTAEFDPLRDEGNAYAAALSAAGVPVQHVQARGHMHTSITMVDVVISGRQHRDTMAAALRGFFA
jgi:cation diffusion facilitator CzcD-associated flavoprotein CzcO/acetyl esterase/lipase